MPQARADYLSGQICAVLANIHRREDAPPFSPEDFMPQIRIDDDEDTAPEELIDIQETSAKIMRILGKKD